MIYLIVYRRWQVKRIDSFISIAVNCKMNSIVHNWYYLHHHSSLEDLPVTLTIKKIKKKKKKKGQRQYGCKIKIIIKLPYYSKFVSTT